MQRPTDTQLLEIWERGYGRQPAELALVMLSACVPEMTPADWLGFSVGQRDARLLRLRQSLFGDSATLVSRCPECAEQMEISLWIEDLIQEQRDHPESLRIECDSWQIGFRVPSTGDLIAVQQLPPGKRRRAILDRCISTFDHDSDENATSAEQLPPAVLKSVVDAMADADPQANLEFDLRCSECQHTWMAPFDIVSFLWGEINAWAQRLLVQIHVLATAYGWTQDEILRLSRWRRQVYQGMARQ